MVWQTGSVSADAGAQRRRRGMYELHDRAGIIGFGTTQEGRAVGQPLHAVQYFISRGLSEGEATDT